MQKRALRSADIIVAGQREIPEAEALAARLEKSGIAAGVYRDTEGRRPDEEGRLVVTDDAGLAGRLAASGIPVLGCLTEGNGGCSFDGVRYLAEGIEDLEEEYLERVYRRLAGLPWYIAETKRLVIRETVEEDLEDFYRIYKDPSVTEFMEDLYCDREKERRYIADYRKNIYEFYGFGMWSVLLKEDGQVIGRAGIDMCQGERYPELGFVIGGPWQRKGYAYEACSAVMRYAESALEMDTVQARCEPENRASAALLEKLGFVLKPWPDRGGKSYRLFVRSLKKDGGT